MTPAEEAELFECLRVLRDACKEVWAVAGCKSGACLYNASAPKWGRTKCACQHNKKLAVLTPRLYRIACDLVGVDPDKSTENLIEMEE